MAPNNWNPHLLKPQANSNQSQFPLDFLHTLTVILPSVTQTVDNLNLTLTLKGNFPRRFELSGVDCSQCGNEEWLLKRGLLYCTCIVLTKSLNSGHRQLQRHWLGDCEFHQHWSQTCLCFLVVFFSCKNTNTSSLEWFSDMSLKK